METGQGVGIEEIDSRVREHIADAASGYLNKERSYNAWDVRTLFSLLERFYRYGLEDRNDA